MGMNVDIICTLKIVRHHQNLLPIRHMSTITPCIPPIKKSRTERAAALNNTATTTIPSQKNGQVNTAVNAIQLSNAK